jgi:hypothetical protein
MNSEESVGQKEYRAPKLSVFAIVFIAVTLVAFLVVYLNTPREASPAWDDGKWSEPLAVNCNEPSIVEFGDKIYMFYSVITENTINNDDDFVIAPQEHILTDVMYLVFDGTNFSELIPLTSASDKVSITGKFFVFKGKLYAALSEWWISNYTSYETKSHVRLEVFDGNSWIEAQGPLEESEMDNYGLPKYFVYSSKAWIVYQNTDGHGHFINVFSYKTFDGSSWSTVRNFTIPAKQPSDWTPLVVNDQLWFVWDNLSFYADPDTQTQPHNDVWLGRFDGKNWSNVTMLSPSDDTGGNWSFFPVRYQDELFTFWGSSYFDTSEHGEWDWVLRRFNLSDSTLGELTPVISERGYKCSPWSTRVFDGRLYVLWYSNYENWRTMIVAFNGTDWSSVYRFDRGYDADGLFVYKDKLWVYGTYESSKLNEAGWTYLRSYSRSS